MAETLIIAALCGVIVGILSGLLGIGGGVIVIPLMRLGFGVPGLVATGTSLFVILPTSISGVIGRLRSKSLNVKIGLCVGLGGVIFSPIGSWASEQAGGMAAMIAAAVVIAYTGANMIRKALKLEKPVAAGNPGESGATSKNTREATIAAEKNMFTDSMNFKIDGKSLAKMLAVGAIAGFLSGFIGVGGGFLIVPMLMWMFGFSFKDASGLSLMALCVLCIPGVITHGLFGNIDYLRGLMLIIGSIPGSFLGTALLKHVHEKSLRIAFGILLFGVGIMLGVNEFVLA
ncbi:MAG: sulfite exporter TauE/SafE family protein [Coriobacteriales bacterium]